MSDDAREFTVRKGQAETKLSKDEFARRVRTRFADPVFEQAASEIARIVELAWEGYDHARKSPRTQKAGPGYADRDYELSTDWIAARDAIAAAGKQHENPAARPRILLVCASPRSDQTCPGEMSKTFRLAALAHDVFTEAGVVCDLLDLSVLTSEYGRTIYPCKGCVSTAMPLCHWPCSCYPNHSLGQVGDWMNEIYPRWVAAHGVMIVTPVHWNQVPSTLKLMMDRLVCADGGNPDPTSTHGKDPETAKTVELAGWDYPPHLKGRAFSVVVHADAEGAQSVRHALEDWLSGMELIAAGGAGTLDRYIGYYDPYATSHEALDKDTALHEEVRNAARSLVAQVRLIRAGRVEPDADLNDPRPK
jgi:multimeric flavodoxin WrbA